MRYIGVHSNHTNPVQESSQGNLNPTLRLAEGGSNCQAVLIMSSIYVGLLTKSSKVQRFQFLPMSSRSIGNYGAILLCFNILHLESSKQNQNNAAKRLTALHPSLFHFPKTARFSFLTIKMSNLAAILSIVFSILQCYTI